MAKEKWLVKRFCQRLEQIADAPCVSSQQKAIVLSGSKWLTFGMPDPSQYTLTIYVFQNTRQCNLGQLMSLYIRKPLVELLLAEIHPTVTATTYHNARGGSMKTGFATLIPKKSTTRYAHESIT